MNKMKKIVLSFFAVIVGVSVSGCWSKKEKKPELYVVNVLDKELFNDCHIKGSIHIPFEEVEQFANKIDKNSHVVFYCSNYMCTASGSSARLFSKLGFKNVWAYEAGMAEWHQAKLPVEGSCKESYLNMKFPKPEHEEKDVQLINTDDLKNKMKEMLSIE